MTRFFFLALVAGLLSGCGAGNTVPKATNQQSNVIFVSIPPLAKIAQEISGGEFEVRSIVQPGDDPHSFVLSSKQLGEVSQARALFTVGMPFLKNLKEYLGEVAPGLVITDLQNGIQLAEFDSHEGHGHEGHDHADEMDPHTWLSPSMLKAQVQNLVAALSEIDPNKAADYTANSVTLIKHIERIDEALAKEFAPYKGRAIYVHHAAFGYFARDYGLEQKSVELGGRAPSAKHLADLIENAKADKVQIIFTQPQFDPSSAEKLAEAIGGNVVAVDPLSPDLLLNFETIGEAIKSALKASE